MTLSPNQAHRHCRDTIASSCLFHLVPVLVTSRSLATSSSHTHFRHFAYFTLHLLHFLQYCSTALLHFCSSALLHFCTSCTSALLHFCMSALLRTLTSALAAKLLGLKGSAQVWTGIYSGYFSLILALMADLGITHVYTIIPKLECWTFSGLAALRLSSQ